METVYPRKKDQTPKTPIREVKGLSLKGDFTVFKFVIGELRRSYEELPVRLILDHIPLRPATDSVAGAYTISRADGNPTIADRRTPPPDVH